MYVRWVLARFPVNKSLLVCKILWFNSAVNTKSFRDSFNTLSGFVCLHFFCNGFATEQGKLPGGVSKIYIHDLG